MVQSRLSNFQKKVAMKTASVSNYENNDDDYYYYLTTRF